MLSNAGSKAAILLAVLILEGFTLFAADGNNTAAIKGVVKNASGETISGAFVNAKQIERGLTFLVVSQDQGRYRISKLPSGTYKVQGIGGGFQSDPPAPIPVAEGQEVTANLTLTGHQTDPAKDLTLADYENMLPEGPGKKILQARCTLCHQLDFPLRRRASREEWQGIVRSMLLKPPSKGKAITGMSQQELDILIDFLATNLGLQSPFPTHPEAEQSSHLPRNLLKGVASKYTVVEYTLPRGATPHDVSVDSQGIAWIGERERGIIGRFDPRTLAYSEIPVPAPKPGAVSYLNAMQVGPQDQLWFTDGNNNLVRYDPKTEKFRSYPLPPPNGDMNTIRFQPDGTIWGTRIGPNQVVRLNPETGEAKGYPAPSGVAAHRSARPYGMAIDGNGKVWFAEEGFNKLGKADPKTGEIAEFVLPVAEDAQPKRMGQSQDGNAWAALYHANKIVKIDYRTDKFTLYTVPTENSGPYSVSVDNTRNLVWFSEQIADKLCRFDPNTKTFVEFTLPTLDSDIRRIEVDPSDPNRIWYSGSGNGGSRGSKGANNIGGSYDKVGYLEVLQ